MLEARTERDRYRGLVKEGIHPSHHRKARKAAKRSEDENTFEAVANEWIAQRKTKWSGYYIRQVEKTLASAVYPYVGAFPLRSVTAAHLLAIIQRVDKRGATTVAILVRQWLSAIFRFGVATLRADTDPASALKGAITRAKVEHRKPLLREDMPAFNKRSCCCGNCTP